MIPILLLRTEVLPSGITYNFQWNFQREILYNSMIYITYIYALGPWSAPHGHQHRSHDRVKVLSNARLRQCSHSLYTQIHLLHMIQMIDITYDTHDTR